MLNSWLWERDALIVVVIDGWNVNVGLSLRNETYGYVGTTVSREREQLFSSRVETYVSLLN